MINNKEIVAVSNLLSGANVPTNNPTMRIAKSTNKSIFMLSGNITTPQKSILHPINQV